MRSISVIRSIVGAAAIFGLMSSHARAQQPSAPRQTTISLDEVISRMLKAESAVSARMRAFHPIVEVYIQNLAPSEELGAVPVKDEYLLGQFDWQEGQGPRLRAMSQEKGSLRQNGSMLSRPFGVQYLPDGFAAMALPDWRLLDGSVTTFSSSNGNFWVRPDVSSSTYVRAAAARRDSPAGSGSRIATSTSFASTASTGRSTRRYRASSRRSCRSTWMPGV